VKTSTIPLSVPDGEFSTMLTRGIPLTSTLPGTPGERIKIVVQDQATGSVGALWLPVN
jgi:hypothetical protein